MDDVKRAERDTAWKLFLSGAITFVLWAIIGAAIWVMATGCSNRSKNHREVGMRWGTEITFFDRTAKSSGGDPNDAYEASSEAPAIVEWLFPIPQPTPGTVPP